jgi:hypothetical protein
MRERVVFRAVEDHRTRAEALYVRVRCRSVFVRKSLTRRVALLGPFTR